MMVEAQHVAPSTFSSVLVKTPFAYMPISTGSGDFIAEIFYLKDDIRRLTIHCVKLCKSKSIFSDNIDYIPVSMSVTGDLAPTLLVTTWASGSAYRVFTYRIADSGVDRVLALSSCTVPYFGVNTRYRYIAVTEGTSRFDRRWITYVWRGGHFVRKPGYPAVR